MNTHTIKAIIFDVDGVIFKAQDQNGKFLWSRTIKEDLGLTSEHFSMIFSEKWEDIIRGKATLSTHLEGLFEERIFQDLSVSPEQYITYWLSKDHDINLDVLNIVEELKIPCYLGTNQEGVRTAHILRSVGAYFEGGFSSHTIGFIKPEPEFFEHIEKTLSLSPNELLLIDDTKINIDGAAKKGWNVYHYQNDSANLIKFLNHHEAGNG